MLYINGTEIKLTRGDSAYLQIPIINKKADGSTEAYELAADDKLTITMAKSYEDTPVFQQTITGSNTFHIRPEDTRECEFGKYKYDVQLVTASGDVYTVIEPALFQVLPEVTRE